MTEKKLGPGRDESVLPPEGAPSCSSVAELSGKVLSLKPANEMKLEPSLVCVPVAEDT